jgi:hypothetical protein
MKTTNSNSPPLINQSFNHLLLSNPRTKKIDFEKFKFDRIHRRAQKKFDERHSGKIKEFNKLRTQWEELYERAKIKEEKYETALKNAPKMSSISASGGTVRFKRFQS